MRRRPTRGPARSRRWRKRGVTRRAPTFPPWRADFAAYEGGDYSAAIEVLGPLVGENERIGGSRAQHDLIEFTLLRAYLGANRLDEARHLLGARRPGASGVPVQGVAAVR